VDLEILVRRCDSSLDRECALDLEDMLAKIDLRCPVEGYKLDGGQVALDADGDCP
jgi:hypothetical protein